MTTKQDKSANGSDSSDEHGPQDGRSRLPREPSGHEEGAVERGKKEGEWVQFDESGRRCGTKTYRQGVLDGPWTLASEGIEFEGVYKAGVQEGPSKMVTKLADGGVCTTTGSYVAGKRHGLWVAVTSGSKKPIGHARVEESFENGVKVSQKQWHDNGVTSCTIGYRDGVKDGETAQWHRNGQLERVQTYRRGRLEGLSTFWHANGKKAREERYEDGKLSGPSSTWHENGQLASESQFLGGKEVGPFRSWDVSGVLVEHWIMVGRARNYLVSRNPVTKPSGPAK